MNQAVFNYIQELTGFVMIDSEFQDLLMVIEKSLWNEVSEDNEPNQNLAILFYDGGRIFKGTYCKGKFEDTQGREVVRVTHWRELPTLPR